MPPPIGRRRIEEFRRAFTGEIDSLAALYRDAAADMMDVLADAATLAGQRGRAVALLRQYQTILADLGDEAAAWIEFSIPRAYDIGLEFADEGVRNIRRAGINLRRRGRTITGRRERDVFSQVHREAARAIMESMLQTTSAALAQIGRRVDDVFRREGMLAVARGIAAGRARVEVSRELEQRLLAAGRPAFVDALGRQWPLDRYAEMVARTTTREAMTQGTINRLREHGVTLAQVSAHNAEDFCRYYENAVVSLNGPHPVYPPITAINGGPPFHPRCVHVLTPFVERLATDEEKKRGIVSPDLLNRSPAELQRRFRKEFPDIARRAGRRSQGRSKTGRLRGDRLDRQAREAERARRAEAAARRRAQAEARRRAAKVVPPASDVEVTRHVSNELASLMRTQVGWNGDLRTGTGGFGGHKDWDCAITVGGEVRDRLTRLTKQNAASWAQLSKHARQEMTSSFTTLVHEATHAAGAAGAIVPDEYATAAQRWLEEAVTSAASEHVAPQLFERVMGFSSGLDKVDFAAMPSYVPRQQFLAKAVAGPSAGRSMMNPMREVESEVYLDLAYRVPRRERFWALAQRMHGAYREAGMTAIEIEAALESEGEHAVEALVARAEKR